MTEVTKGADSAPPEFATFSEFWPYYVGAHKDIRCRILHHVGGVLAIGFVVLAIVTQTWWWLLAAPIAGYGLAWTGHFRYEQNTPATFDYPLYSVIAEFKMLVLGLSGRMGREVRRYYGDASPGR